MKFQLNALVRNEPGAIDFQHQDVVHPAHLSALHELHHPLMP